MGRLPFIVLLHLIPSTVSLLLSSVIYRHRKRWPLTLRSPRFTIALSFLFSIAFFLSSLPQSQINLQVSPPETSLKCATFFGLLFSVVNCIMTTCLFRLWSLLLRTQLSGELMKLKEGYHHQRAILQNYGPLKNCWFNRQRFLAVIASLYCLDILLPVLTSVVNPTCSRDSPLGFLSDRILVIIATFANLYAILRLTCMRHPIDPFFIRSEFILTFLGGLCLAASALKIRTEQFNLVFECVSCFFTFFVYFGPIHFCYQAYRKTLQRYDPNDNPAYYLTSSMVPRRAIYKAYLEFLYAELSGHELLFWRDVYDFKRTVNKFQKLLNTKPKDFPKISDKWHDLNHRTEHILQFYLSLEAPFRLTITKDTLENVIADWTHFRSLIPTFIHEPIEIPGKRRKHSTSDNSGSDGSSPPSPVPEKEDSEERKTHDEDLVEFSNMFTTAQTEVENHLCEESWRRYRDSASSAFTAPLESTRSTEEDTDKPKREDYDNDEKHAAKMEKKHLLEKSDEDHAPSSFDQKISPRRSSEEPIVSRRDQVIEMSVREKKKKTGKLSVGKSLLSKAKKQLQSLEKMSDQIAEVKQTALTNVTRAKEKFKAYYEGWLETKELQKSAEVTSGLKNFNRGMGHFLDVYREQDPAQKVDDRIARALDAIGHQV